MWAGFPRSQGRRLLVSTPTTNRDTALQRVQIALQLPRLDLRVIFAPFVSLQVEKLGGDGTKTFAHDAVLLELFERFGQALRKRPDSACRHCLDLGCVEVAQIGLAGIELSLD